MGKVNGNFAFDIDMNVINNAVQNSVSKTIASLNIKERVDTQVNRVMQKHADKAISDGSFYESLAKNLATKIDISKIIEMIDMNELKTMIAERVSQKIVEKMK